MGARGQGEVDAMGAVVLARTGAAVEGEGLSRKGDGCLPFSAVDLGRPSSYRLTNVQGKPDRIEVDVRVK